MPKPSIASTKGPLFQHLGHFAQERFIREGHNFVEVRGLNQVQPEGNPAIENRTTEPPPARGAPLRPELER